MEINKYVLYLGDCLEEMNKISDKSIDMILCDLPYGTTACSWDVIIPFEPLWEHYNRIIKDNGCIALFGSEPFSSHLRMSNIKSYKYDIYWNKERPTNFMNLKFEFGKVIENISIFGKGKLKFYPILEESWLSKNRPNCKNISYNLNRKLNTIESLNSVAKVSIDFKPDKKFPTNLLKFSRNHKSKRYHPTQKPVSLLEYLIKTYTLENEIVLDNTMGSGSTGVSCMNTNRKFIGIEKDEKYFNIAKERIKSVNYDWIF